MNETKFYHLLQKTVKSILRAYLHLEIREDPAVTEWKKQGIPFVILCAHPSELDAVILLSAAAPRYARFVAGSQQLYKGMQGKLLRAIGVIPKKQFTPDITSIREMMQTVRDGHILGFMPEGRVSSDGTPNSIDISTAKLLKKLKAPVAVLKPEGTYFVKPPYNYAGIKRGKIGGRLSALFTAEDIAEKTPEQILDSLTPALDYNACEELRGSGRLYGKRKDVMSGVSRILYRCPECKSLYSISDSDGIISCSSCGLRVKAGRDMFFAPERLSMAPARNDASTELISDCVSDRNEFQLSDCVSDRNEFQLPDCVSAWNEFQLSEEEQFWKEPQASLSFNVEKYMLRVGTDEEYSLLGKGSAGLTKEMFFYKDEQEDIQIPLSSIPGVSADYMHGFIALYEGDLIRRFVFEDPQKTMRFVNSMRILKQQ